MAGTPTDPAMEEKAPQTAPLNAQVPAVAESMTAVPDEAVGTRDKDGAEEQPDEDIVYPTGIKLLLIIVSVCLSVFLVALDQTIVAPALGAITAEFGSVGDIGWYGSAYLLTTNALQPTYGKIYRLFSVKYTFLTAVFLFEVGSLVCAVAPTSTALIVGRAVAGLGTAGLFSGAVVIISHTLPLRRRPAFFGLIGAMWGLASVAGPLLGGAFTDHATWRWCFYVNLPIGGLAMVCIFFFLHVNRVNNPDGETLLQRIQHLDLLGAAILIPAVICLLLALQWGGEQYPWSDSRIIGLFVGFGVMAILFIGVQIWKGDEGTLPPRLFRNRDIVCAMTFAFFFGAGFFSLVYYLSIYFQAIQGDSAVQAGLKLLPLFIAVVITSMLNGAFTSLVGYYNPFILPCMVLFAVGAGMITTFAIDSPLRVWFGYQVICGLGVGAGFQIGALVVQNTLPFEWVSVGTASVQFFQSLGGAIFIAVAQATFQNGLTQGVQENAPGIPPEVFIHSGASQVREILEAFHAGQLLDAVLEAYLLGLRHTYYITVGCACMTFCAAAGLSWKKIERSKPRGAVAPNEDVEAANSTSAEVKD